MVQSKFEISVNLSEKEVSDAILHTLESFGDIERFEYRDSEIFASTKANMKTFGDQIYIRLTNKKECTHVYICSQTPGQLVDWGRNKENINNIITPLLKYESTDANVSNVSDDDSTGNENVGSIAKCPDCGKIWAYNEIPNKCDVCGCPLEFFETVQQVEHKSKDKITSSHQRERKQKHIIIGALATVAILLLIIGLSSLIIGLSSKQSYEEWRSNNSGYEEEYNETTSMSDDNANLSKLCSHSWKTILAGDPYGECMLEVVKFNSNGIGHVNEMHYAGGNKINASNFDFNFELKGENVIVEGSIEFTFDGYDLYDADGRHYQSGSSLQY